MNSSTASATPSATPSDTHALAPGSLAGVAARLKDFAVPDRRRSIVQLCVTGGIFVLTWLAMWVSMEVSYLLTLGLGVVGGAFLVRLFMIQHDCAHGSFFKSRRANDMVGRIIGVLTMTPYGYWKSTHAQHHATAGNLDRRGVGDVTTLTADEFRNLSPLRRLAYRAYRHPLVLLGVGPAFLFIIQHRLPVGLPLRRWQMWLSVLGTNVALGAALTGLAFLVGPLTLVKLQLPVMLIASSIGVWLFFIQHQFEGVYWRRQEEWRHAEASLYGSSYYALPRVLHWLTANIGLHHVHHLCSRIPNYRLRDAIDQVPDLQQVKPVRLLESLRYATLALWDEAGGRLVRFRDLKEARGIAPRSRVLREGSSDRSGPA